MRARASSTPQSDRSRQKSVLTHYQKAQSASKSVESFFAKQGRESEGKKKGKERKKMGKWIMDNVSFRLGEGGRGKERCV